jgi:hypothetical protein
MSAHSRHEDIDLSTAGELFIVRTTRAARTPVTMTRPEGCSGSNCHGERDERIEGDHDGQMATMAGSAWMGECRMERNR